jgi:hypothetical protein
MTSPITHSIKGTSLSLYRFLEDVTFKIANVVFDNDTRNAKYILVLAIQKRIMHVFANKVKKLIHGGVKIIKFYIIVDEAVNATNKEQITIILRYVD